jgi:GTP cyclohydrolase I
MDNNWIEMKIHNDNLPDVQKNEPNFPVYIDRVGISNLKMPIRILIKNEGEYTNTVADISAYVDLPKTEKGTHMSRLAIAIQNQEFNNFNSNILRQICKEIKNSCQSDKSQVIYKFPYFQKKYAPVSKISGWVHYDVIFDMTMDKNDDTKFLITVKSVGTSVCPCSKEISDGGAHNQRSLITITAEHDNNKSTLWIEDLIDIAEFSASEQIYSVLKREDEKHVTENGYNNPLFVEDIIRNCYMKLICLENIKSFKINVENEESIHLHNAYASISWNKDINNGREDL